MNSRVEFVCSLAESAGLTLPANGGERSEPELRFNQVVEHLPHVILAEDTNESPAFDSELRPAVGRSQQVSERAVIKGRFVLPGLFGKAAVQGTRSLSSGRP
ncbi:hypothetical protein SSP24_47460 [Streptomyces spinoverrucosus]|uniref:Uncharacterized protein n=1 Tax=Streptomyces spinoverrucosus TaxID=284043 RepID=A0A4Y3VMX1_9ACTN|nr:hypothetical protein [Streptomyces spinoverrucosus]GEC07091.1 hypothetical protein SSP24_47460 [Streptomyces spinoverrucosus]GHB92137.1 hypothetical protein GCM10010397_75610 [Streptomyces spinoverrucosus]